ncbi:MAG: class I SAM-dependent methyltransferase [Chloroflexota bacterium]
MTEKNVSTTSVIKAYNTIAPFYGLFTSPYDDQIEANFILTYALRAGVALDVGAGQGDIALALAARGVAVYCVEPALAMRQAILTRLTSQPSLMPYLTVLLDSATDMVCQRRFPLIYMFYMFQHILASGERQTILNNLAQHLAPGGTLLLNLWVYEHLQSQELTLARHKTVGDITYRQYIGYNVHNSTRFDVLTAYEVWFMGHCIECVAVSLPNVVLRCTELYDQLSKAGLRVRREYAGYDWAPFCNQPGLWIIEATHNQGDEYG